MKNTVVDVIIWWLEVHISMFKMGQKRHSPLILTYVWLSLIFFHSYSQHYMILSLYYRLPYCGYPIKSWRTFYVNIFEVFPYYHEEAEALKQSIYCCGALICKAQFAVTASRSRNNFTPNTWTCEVKLRIHDSSISISRPNYLGSYWALNGLSVSVSFSEI